LGMDGGGYVFRIGPDGDVEIGGSGSGGSDLTIKQNLALTGGNITINKISTPGALSSSTTDGGGSCTSNTLYYYKLTAINDNGETPGSAEKSQTSNNDDADNDERITISWSAVSGVTGYKLYRSLDQDWADADNYLVDNTVITATTTSYVDDCSGTDADNPPTINTTGGDLYVLNNLGVGTTGPDAKLDILDVSGAQMRLTYANESVYTDFTLDTTGNLEINPAENVYFKNDASTGTNLWVCEGAACPGADTSMGSTGGNLVVEGGIYGGTTCPPDMVYVPGDRPFCIDKYEAYNSNSGTVCNNTDCPCTGGTQVQVDANTTTTIAGSAISQTPLATITWCSAKKACENAGKHLCTNTEWFQACNYKGGQWNITDEEDDETMDCNTASGAAVSTGSRSGCVTQEGALDMIGNVWEWVDKIVTTDPTNGLMTDQYITGYDFATALPTSTGAVPDPVYGDDYFWAHDVGETNAALRGGCWGYETTAGCFALNLGDTPSSTSALFGFRCCR